MFRHRLANAAIGSCLLRSCATSSPSSNAARLTNLLKVMKKEPGRTPDADPSFASLNLFRSKEEISQERTKQLWSELEQEELKLYEQKSPKNAFEEMINWTNDGKLWKYPINNEDGLAQQTERERFDDHVFFDDLIEQSPDKQPIREFMTDAALGLSKNPYMTAERKRSYLQYYNEYFNENKELVDTLVDDEETK